MTKGELEARYRKALQRGAMMLETAERFDRLANEAADLGERILCKMLAAALRRYYSTMFD